jgi:hypothetical protein
MADKKISALTAAATPLAGTEVLPIVQSGATVKVAVSDLTTGRSVPMVGIAGTGLSALGAALNANWDTASKGAQLGTYGALYELEVDATVALGSNLLVSTASSGATKYIATAPAARVKVGTGTISLDIATSGTAGTVIGSNFFTSLSTDTTGNVTLPVGNLVIGTSGKGVTLPGGITWTSGSGSPEGVVTAPIGSLYSRSDGGLLTSLYVKQSGSGNTGWAGK